MEAKRVSFLVEVTYAEGFGDADDLFEGLEIGVNDHGGMDLTLEEALNSGHDLSSKDDHRGGAVTDLLILSACELDHALSSGMSNIDL